MSSFVARHKKDWEELERLTTRARRWRGGMSSAERQRLDELYRRTSIHLARASTSGDANDLVEYLNGLTAAAHTVIYLPPRETFFMRIARFAAEGFPRAVARNWRQHALSALLLITGAVVGFIMASSDPATALALWPASDPRQPGSTPEQLLSYLRHGRDETSGEKFLFASFLFQHNLKVAILSMATGVLAAAPTVLLILLNGMILGVFAAIHHQAGLPTEMWAWILPHGVTELGAIVLCGGVGLMLGKAVVRPGTKSRNQSLLDAGREAAKICIGAGGMLVLAALIESYVRQSTWSTPTRLCFAAGTVVFWTLYFSVGLVRERQAKREALTTAPQAAQAVLASAQSPTADFAVAAQRID